MLLLFVRVKFGSILSKRLNFMNEKILSRKKISLNMISPIL